MYDISCMVKVEGKGLGVVIVAEVEGKGLGMVVEVDVAEGGRIWAVVVGVEVE